jgi:hypothetical protein
MAASPRATHQATALTLTTKQLLTLYHPQHLIAEMVLVNSLKQMMKFHQTK